VTHFGLDLLKGCPLPLPLLLQLSEARSQVLGDQGPALERDLVAADRLHRLGDLRLDRGPTLLDFGLLYQRLGIGLEPLRIVRASGQAFQTASQVALSARSAGEPLARAMLLTLVLPR
jgi:hypothetical protein